MRTVLRVLRWVLIVAVAAVAAIVGVRAVQAIRDPVLAPWHLVAPEEPDAAEIAAMSWEDWLAAEATLEAEALAEVAEGLDLAEETRENRYWPKSPIYAAATGSGWNRSFEMAPQGQPRGAAVLVHGLTDSPYSVRHLAALYRDAGFYVVAPRMPGHGTTPGGLSKAVWPQWMAALEVAIRRAQAQAGPDAPLHLLGYSNGGALVTLHALEALDDPAMAAPDRLVLISPMIGVTRFARFAGIAGWPAALPGFVRAAWFDLIPEFNPFKYNSFPVHAAVQTHRLTRALQAELEAASRSGRMAGMPPVLAFQSVVDATVSTRAVVDELFARLPRNGSELVLADLNRAATLAPVLSAAAQAEIGRLLPPAPRAYGVTVLTNEGPGQLAAAAVEEPAGTAALERRPLGVDWPADVYSLSHVALPFPVTDGLYGLAPDPADDFGIRIGTLAARGETGVLSVNTDMFARLYSNPFYGAVEARIAAAIAADLE